MDSSVLRACSCSKEAEEKVARNSSGVYPVVCQAVIRNFDAFDVAFVLDERCEISDYHPFETLPASGYLIWQDIVAEIVQVWD